MLKHSFQHCLFISQLPVCVTLEMAKENIKLLATVLQFTLVVINKKLETLVVLTWLLAREVICFCDYSFRGYQRLHGGPGC